MATIPRPSLPGRALACAPALLLALASSGCPVVDVAVAGKVVEKTVDLAVPGGGAAPGK